MGIYTADELRFLRAYPRHFDLDGTPVLVRTSGSLPQAYAGGGHWHTLSAVDELLVHGKLVTEKRFESNCRYLDQFFDSGRPFIDAAEENDYGVRGRIEQLAAVDVR